MRNLLNKVLEIEVKNSTPILIGGYDTQAKSNIHRETLRTQSLKGLWRWWLRALIAGKYWGTNIDEDNLVKTILNEEGLILGFTDKKGAEASKLAIRFLEQHVDYGEYHTSDIPRIRLLTLRGKISYIKSLKGLLSVYSREYQGESLKSEELKLATTALLLSLSLSGLGKGGRRGLGCLDLKVVKDDVKLPEVLKQGLSREAIEELLRDRLKSIPRREISDFEDLPPMPAIAPNSFKLWFIDYKSKNVMNVLRDFQDFTLNIVRGASLIPDPLRSEFKTWILGLPRRNISTFIQRRASPLIMAIHSDFATISLFKSKDWPDKVEYHIRPRKPINVHEKLIEAYNTLEKTLTQFMERKGYKLEVGVF